MIKTIANSVFVIIISTVMLVADEVISIGFNEVFVRGYTFTMYWGWFDWLTILGWAPRIFTGFLTGVCVTLLVFGRNQKNWALFAGSIVSALTFVISKLYWVIEPSWVERAFYNVWPIMYVVGAWFGYIAVLKIKYFIANWHN